MSERAYQTQMTAEIYDAWAQGARNVCAVLPTGCHAPGTEILMHDGSSRAVENIRVGDALMGPDSRPRIVTELHSGTDEMVRVTPKKGAPFVVNVGHILALRRTNDGSPRVGHITDISVDEWRRETNTFRHVHKLWRPDCVEFPTRELPPLDPWFLGAIVGDGCLRRNINITTPDDVVVIWFMSVLRDHGATCRFDHKENNRAITVISGTKKSDICEILTRLGLWGGLAADKFIPDEYKLGSIKTRLETLAGLIDTDGHYCTNGTFDWISKSRQLADDVVFMCRSVGLAAQAVKCEKYCQTGAGGVYYRVCISGNIEIIPTRVLRKQARPRRQKKNVRNVGFSVEAIGRGAYYGFSVTSDRRYLTADFMVHHNSGKSVVVSGIVQREHARNVTQCVIAHRVELVSQMSMHVASRGVPHRLIAPANVRRRIDAMHREQFNGKSYVDNRSSCAVVAVNTLLARVNDPEIVRWAPTVQQWITDECFVAGTLVDTPSGQCPIEALIVGDEVIAFDERDGLFHTRKIVRTFRNYMHAAMIRLRIDERVIECTGLHPFWTQRGWIFAKDLTCDDRLYVHGMWIRLDSVEIFQPNDNGKSGRGDAGRYVYNIEVEELHTYVANGVVTHNCHHILNGNLWGRGVALFPNARGLGVTATPARADGMGLGRHHDGVMDALVTGPTMRELINAGYLSDYEIVCPTSDLVMHNDDIGTTGDYSQRKLAAAAKASHIVGDVVEQWQKFALHKRTIIFVTDVETAGKVASNFKAASVRAEAVSAETPDVVRDDYVRRFKNGEITVLINVDLFGEGFDVPGCECVVMARPTASLGVYLQQFGRALRPSEGKSHGLVIDMVSNVTRHGFPDKPHAWTLDRRDRRAKRDVDPDDVVLTACVECSRPYDRALHACPHCGHEPVIEPSARGNIEQIDGDLILLDRDALARLRTAMELPSAADVSARAMHVAGPAAAAGAGARQRERIEAQRALHDAIELWAGHQRALERSDRESYRRFFRALGVDVLSALALPRADMDRLRATIEGWLK